VDRRTSAPAERAVYLSFDDRLAYLPVEQLGLLLEEYYRRFPELRGCETVWWLLDEMQRVKGWERFVRRAFPLGFSIAIPSPIGYIFILELSPMQKSTIRP
jgi:predicted AAA+ superfamily ATPase